MKTYENVPLTILAGPWAAFDIVLKAFQVLNERRDLYAKLKSNYSEAAKYGLTPNTIFYSDWLPL
jgi:hypothetical protein